MAKYGFERIRFFLNKHKVVLSIILIHCLITIPLAYILNTHFDEACSLYDTNGTLSHTIKSAITFDNQAPLYFVFLDFWRKIDSSFFFARLFSIVFSSLTIFVCYRFLEKYAGISKPGWVTFLIAINPFLIDYAVEIRLYTLMVFLSVVLIYLMYKIYLYDNQSKKYRIFFILASIISLHIHYYMGFLLVAIGANVLIYKGWKKFNTYLIDMTLPLFSLLFVIPFMGSISRQIGASSNQMNLKTILDYFRDQIILSQIFSFNLLPYPLLSKYLLWAFLIVAASIYLISIKDHFKNFIRILKLKEYSTIPVIIVLLLFYLLIILKFGFLKLQIRYTASLFFPLVLTVASFIYISEKKKFLIFWFLLFTFLYSSSLINVYAPMAKQGDWIRISKYLETNEKSSEPILIPDSTYAMPFKVHYKGPNSVITMYDKKTENNLIKTIEARSSNNYWWVFQDPEWQTHAEDAEVAKKFISDNFNVISKKSFHLWMQVWYIKRKN